MKQLQCESREEAEARVAQELTYEEHILNKPSDHPGPPLLVGVCTERTHYLLIMQFHGDQEGTPYTISTVLSKKKEANSLQDDLDKDSCKNSESLAHIQEKGFLQNDLKSNNVVINNRDGVHRVREMCP